jgi:CubicO group peptidase (beta-lactamase class C family)
MLKSSNIIDKMVLAILLLAFPNLRGFTQNPKLPGLATKDQSQVNRLESELEQLRSILKIPGMSAAIVKDQQLIWAKGFGYSDYENRVAATENTPYEAAGISMTFAATLLMQLVEQGKVSLDDPMSKYSAQYKDEAIKVRHVLSHTSEGLTPGDKYGYNGNLFSNLFNVVVKGSGKRYRALLVQNMLEKIGTTDTSPGNDLNDPDSDHARMAELLGADNEKNYVDVIKRLAKPYRLYGSNAIVLTYNSQRGLSTSNGIISSVVDLAKYDVAIDRHLFLKKETQEQMWTPAVSNMPYGLGWFVQQYRGHKLIWHSGNLPYHYSALILKIPDRQITFILLANSDALTSPFRLARGIVMNSPFANVFMRLFVFEDETKTTLPTPGWGAHEKEFQLNLKNIEKKTQGYKYEMETGANNAIRSWLDERRAEAHHEIKLDPKTYEAYAGEYQVGTSPPFTILIQNGNLIRQGRSTFELFPESETVFFAKAVDAQFIFIKDEKGQTQVKIKQGENEVIALKLK